MLTLISRYPERRDFDPQQIQVLGHDYLQGEGQVGHAALVEPVFHDFRRAGDNELGFAFLAFGALRNFKRLTIGVSYSQANAMVYRGYLQDLKDVMSKEFEHVTVKHIPYVTCGVPMGGSFMALTGSHEPWSPKSVEGTAPVMPSQYIPGLLSHVTRNRPNYPIMVSARQVGAVRSDLNLLPAVPQWVNKSLFVEYRDGATTKLRRMKMEDVGRIFGVKPCEYNDDLADVLPGEVVKAFV